MRPLPQSPSADPPTASHAAEQRPRAPRFLELLHGLYAWLEFVLIGLAALLALLLLPSLRQRRALVHTLARAALGLAAIRLELVGLSRMPRPCVLIANHSSYLDGVVMAAALSGSFTFVIKHEMAKMPFAGTLLRRIGAEFIERRSRARSASAARRLLRAASGGEALVFFPEGTFSSEPGLLRFHMGAFATAARSGLPLVPVVIRGTRHCLAPGSLWPRPGRVRIEALPPLSPHASLAPKERAAELRVTARAVLLAALGEPDLEAAS